MFLSILKVKVLEDCICQNKKYFATVIFETQIGKRIFNHTLVLVNKKCFNGGCVTGLMGNVLTCWTSGELIINAYL